MHLPQSDEDTRILIREGYYYLVIVEGEEVTHHTANFGLSHVEFVKRSTGELPEGAWVGSATKNDGRLSAVNSFTFYRNQLPGPEHTQRAVFKKFR